MNITKDLKVEIQPRFEGATRPLAFYDVTGRVDADDFEFTSSTDGSTASANINIYTLFPFSSKRWNEYAATEADSIKQALLDPTFRFEIPLRSEIKISESFSDMSKHYAITHYSQSQFTVTLTLNRSHTLVVGNSVAVTLAGDTQRSPDPITLGGQRVITAVTSTTISYLDTTSRTINQTAVASGINTATLQVIELIFGGVMLSVEESRVGGAITQKITCADYTALLDERVIENYRVAQDTYGWELIIGGQEYAAGKIGINRMSISTAEEPSYTLTQEETVEDTDVHKASIAGSHGIRKNERFWYTGNSQEYQVVGLWEGTNVSGIYYTVCNGSPGAIVADGQQFKIWNHQVAVDSAEDHLLQVSQTFAVNHEWAPGNWNGIAKLDNTQYVVDIIEDSRKFFFVHRVGTTAATGSTPFTNGNIVAPYLASGYDPVAKEESTSLSTFTTGTPHGLVAGDTVLFSPATYTALAPWSGGFAEVSTAYGTWYSSTVEAAPDAYNFQTAHNSSGGDSEARIQDYTEEYPLEIQALTLSIFDAIRTTDPYSDNYDGLDIDYTTKVDPVETARLNPILYQWLPGYPTVAYADSNALDRETTVADFWAIMSRNNESYSYDPIVATDTTSVRHMPKVQINPGSPKKHRLQAAFRAPISISGGDLVITIANNLVENDEFYLRKIDGLSTGTSPAFRRYTVNDSTTGAAIHATIGAEDPAFTLSGGATAEVVLLPVHDEQAGTLKIYTQRHHMLEAGQQIDLQNYKLADTQLYEGGVDNTFTVEAVSSKVEDTTREFSSISLQVGTQDPGLELYPNKETPSNITTFVEEEKFLTTRTKRYRIIHVRKENSVVSLTAIIAEVIISYEVVSANQIKITLNVEADSFSENQIVRVFGLIPPFPGLYSVSAVDGKTVTLTTYGSVNLFTTSSNAVSGTPTWNATAKQLTITSTAHPFAVGDYVSVYYASGAGAAIYREKIVAKTTNNFTIGRPFNPSLGALTNHRAAKGYSCAYTAKSFNSGAEEVTLTAASHAFHAGDYVNVAGDAFYEVTSVTKDTVVISSGSDLTSSTGTISLGIIPETTTAASAQRYTSAGHKKDVLEITTVEAHGLVRNPTSLIDVVPVDVIPELQPEGGVATILDVLGARTFVVGADSTGTLTSAGTPFDMVVDKSVGNFGAENSGALGVVASRADDGIVEHEAIFISGAGSPWDTTTKKRVGGLVRYQISDSENPMTLYWEPSGIVTLYMALALDNDKSEAFKEGKSIYIDVGVTNAGYENKFAGIRTIINSSAVAANDEHAELRGKTAGMPYIQWVQNKPGAGEAGSYAVADGSVISADVIQYVDNNGQPDSVNYIVANPQKKNRIIGNFTQASLTHWTYLNGVFRFKTLKPHKRKNGHRVYFASIGEMQRALSWDFRYLAPTTSKKKIITTGFDANTFGISVGDGSYTIKSMRCTNPTGARDEFEVELAEECAELYVPQLGFSVKGVAGTYGTSLANLTYLSGAFRITGKKFQFGTNFGVLGIPSNGILALTPGATINFKAQVALVAFATMPQASFTDSSVSTTQIDSWNNGDLANPFKAEAGTNEKNYVNDLKIPKGDGGAFAEMYYYEYLAKTMTGSYTSSHGRYFVVTDEPHNLGDRQPRVNFTPSGGSVIHVSDIDDPANQLTVTGTNAFTFYHGSATVTTPTACTIQTRAAYTPSSTQPAMPRNPDVYIGGNKALNFVKSKWNLLRTDNAYPSFTTDLVSDTSVKYDQWWTFILRPNTITSDMIFLQRGNFQTYMAFGINSTGHPYVELYRNSGPTLVQYAITAITIAEEEECVLQFTVSIDPTTRVASIAAYKNFDESGTATSAAVFPLGGIETSAGVDPNNGLTDGTIVVGAGADFDALNTYRNPFDGYIGEIVGFDRLPETTPYNEGERMRAWLLHKWGLASLIDPDYNPDYRDINNVPKQKLPDSKQTPLMSFGGRTLRQALDAIIKITGAQFWVNKNKELEYKKINTSNLIKNSMFENDRGDGSVKRWNGTVSAHTVAKNDAGKYDRTVGPYGYGYAMKASGTSATSVYSDFIDEGPSEESFVANDLFFVSSYVKSSDTTRMAVRVHFYSTATNTVGSTYANSYEDLYLGWCNVNEWRRVWKIVKMPAGSTKFTVGLLALAGGSSATHYWTDIRAVKLTGEFGFADEGNYKPQTLLLNSGETNTDMPIATYPFESPDNIRSAGASANRLYLYATIPNSDEDGISTTAVGNNQEILQYTFDHVQGVWDSHGKIIEGSTKDDKAQTLREVSGRAATFFNQNGTAAASYQFEHPNNGLPGLLTPGSVIPYLWSEVDIWEPMIVKSQSSKLIGPELYHTVTLQQEPDYQKNALVLIARRTIAVDLGTLSPASSRPPDPQRFVVQAKDPDGLSNTVDTVFDLSWQYQFADPRAKGVDAGGFEIQVRKRKRTLKQITKARAGIKSTAKAVSWSASNGEPQTLVTMIGKYPGVEVGTVVRILKLPTPTSNKLIPAGLELNGTFRVNDLVYSSEDPKTRIKIGFNYYVATPEDEVESTESAFKSTPAGYLLGKVIPSGFAVEFKATRKGAYDKWLIATDSQLETKGTNTRASWNPAKLATDTDPTGDQGIDQDYQFRIRAVSKLGTNAEPVYNYSAWVQYPEADDFVTIGGEDLV